MTREIDHLPIFQAAMTTNLDPDKTAITFINTDGSDVPLTFGDIYRNTNRVSRALLKAGIRKGDTFTLLMRNHPEFLYAMYSAVSLGAIVVLVDPRSKGRKLAYQIKKTDSKGIIVEDDFLESLREIKDDIRDVPIVGVSYKDHHHVPVSAAFPSMNEILAGESPEYPDRAPDFDLYAPAQIIHTSGTTGDPKGVVLKNDRFQIYALFSDLIWKYQKDDILYTGLSMTHGNAQAVTIFPAMHKQLPVFMSERFTKSNIWRHCKKYNCTTFPVLGGMMAGIYNEPVREDDGNNPVRKVISAGTPPPYWEPFENRFGVQIHEWYSAVEGGLAHLPPGSGPKGSFGKPIEGLMEMKIVDDNDNELPPGSKGELISRMPLSVNEVEYYGKKKESEEKTRGGWLRSGDICHKDENGYYYFDYRKGGGLRRQGEFIQPELVEKIIGEHETVSEVSVYGIPAVSAAPGESDIVAAIAPFPGMQVDVEGVEALCRGELERNAMPAYFQIVDEIPKTVSEKHLKRVLQGKFDPEAPGVVIV